MRRSERERILAVHQGGGVGGAPVSLLKLLGMLDRNQFEVRAVFTEPGPIQDFAHQMGVPAEVVPTGGAFFYSAHARLSPRTMGTFLRTFPEAVRRARMRLRTERPDVLHLNTSVLLAWAVAARREGVPVVWMVREVLAPVPIVRRWHARFIVRHAARVVGISESVRACFPPGSGVERVYNSVDLAEFNLELLDEPGREKVRSSLGIGLHEQVVMAVGAVQRPKGHWLMLDAFERVLRQQPASRLVLVCGGADARYRSTWRGRLKGVLGLPLDALDALLVEAAKRGLRERVLVTGFRRDIARVVAAADVVAFLSLEPEGFGRPLIEAMAMRRPVVATDIGPSAEILGPNAGYLVQADAEVVASAFSEVMGSPERARRMGEAGRARVEQMFTLDIQRIAMQRMYQDVLHERV